MTLPPPRSSVLVVTGAGGWLGRNLVSEAATAGRRVRALVQSSDEVAVLALAGATVEPVVGDVLDPGALDRLFADVPGGASVVHAAGVIHPTAGVRQLFDVNVGGTSLVLHRARRAGAGRFVHVSSNSPFGVNPDPAHSFDEGSSYAPYLGYGASKQEAEELVRGMARRGDVDAVIVRPPWFYGPHQPERQVRWLRAVRRGRFPLVGDGSNRRSMVFTGNLVQGILRAEALGATGEAYWIADAEPHTMTEVLATVRDAFRAEGMAVSGGSPRLPRLAGVVAERGDRALQRMGRYHQALHVLGELKESIVCDIGRARRELGYEPEVDLYEGMRRSIRWSRARGADL